MREGNQSDSPEGPDSAAPPAAKPRRRRRHPLRLALEALGVLVGGFIIMLGVLAYRVSQGPIVLNMLSPTIAEALKNLDPAADVSVGETVVLWSESRGTVQLQARDVHIRGPGGDERASVPELSLALSIPALLHGVIAPSAFEIYGLHVTLVRGADGRIQFGDAKPEPAAPAEEHQAELSGNAVEMLLSFFAAAPDPAVPSSYLKRVGVVDAQFTLDDRKTGHVWRAPEAHLSIVRDAQGAEGRVALAVDLAGAKPHADLVVRYRRGQDDVTVDAVIRDLAPAALAAAADEPLLAALGVLDAPVTAQARGAIALDGTIRRVGFQADIGAGRIVFSRAGLGGDDEGVPLVSARIEAEMSEALDRVSIRRLDLNLDGGKLAITGDATLDDVPTVHFTVESPGLSTATLVRYWPPEVAHNAREWLAENLEAGVAEDAKFSGELGPVGPNQVFDIRSLDGAFRVRDISVAYFRPLPSATRVSGTATMTADTLSFQVAAGRIGDLAISNTTVKVGGLDTHDQTVAVEATVTGPLTGVFDLLDREPLGFISKVGIDPKAVTGDTANRIRIALPLKDHIDFADVGLLVNSNVRGVTIPKVALGLDVADADGTVVADGKGLSVRAKGKVAGSDAEFAFNENFDGGPGFKRKVWVRGTLDEAARETIGISLAPYVSGPTGVEAFIVQPDDKRTKIEAIADLTPATLTFSDFGWGKNPDEHGTAAVRATLRDDKVTAIDLLEVRSGDLTATGRVGFDADGKTIASATFPRIAFGGETDIRLDAIRSPTTGTYMMNISGPKLNVEPILDVHDSDDSKEGTPMIVDVAVGSARLGEGGGVTGVAAHLERNRERWNVMTIDAGVGESASPVSLRMAPDGNGRTFTFTSADAGATVKALDIISNVRGGTLSFAGRYDDSDPKSPLKGKIEMRGFRLVGAPVLARVLAIASFTGLLDVLRGQGIDFTRFDANVTFVDGAVYTDDLLAHGSALGFTARGNVNLREKTIDVQGTIVPAYSLNSVLGNIPLLGPILTQGGGVFAANYRVRGSIDNPDVTVNPLSTLAPSFLRNLFNIFQAPAQTAPSDTTPQAPAPTPAPDAAQSPPGPIPPRE